MLQGLSENEVFMRRAQGKGNNVELATSRSYLQILRHNLFTFINMVLFSIGIILVVMGLPGDALATAGLVLINVLVGMVQEIRAKRKLDQIALLTRPKVTALRDGQEKTIDPSEIVLGDILLIQPGDQIVVDGVIQDEGKVEIDESLLTGESDAIIKTNGDTVYSGSFCITGKAIYEANKVGADSFAHKMTSQARNFRFSQTPLQRDVTFIIRLVAIISSVIGILMYIGAERNNEPIEQSVQSLAVVVGLIPQGLIFLTTLSYALGAVRIAGKGALVQQSSAVESMSNIDVLCLDKTGTLTTNRIKFHETHPLTAEADQLKKLLGIYAASTPTHNRTSEAILEAFKEQSHKVVTEVPFSSARKWSALVFDEPDLRGVYVLGAPEILQPHLKADADLGNEQGENWMNQGLRVVLFAHQPEPQPITDKLPDGLIPLGLISFSDELRPEAEATLKGFVEAGIQIKIISGDNPQTVAALAKQVQFPGMENAQLATGTDLSQLSDAEFAQVAERTTVFGRITPYQKEKLVRALQSNGHYVAMIGDGVNDVLSLKQAEIGIAMQSGSPATRSVAEIVLLNDTFAVLPDAFKEGQRIINGMQDITRILLARTFYMVFLIIGAALIKIDFPLKPTYDTLIATLTVGIPGPALAAWSRPGKLSRSLLRAIIHFVMPAAFTIAMTALGIYIYFLETNGDVIVARTALTATLGLCGLILLPFVEPPTPAWVGGDDYSGDWRPSYIALGMLALLLSIFFVPYLREMFDLALLSAGEYALIVLVTVIWAVVLRALWVYRVFERFIGFES